MNPPLVNADWNYWPEGIPLDGIWRSCAEIGFDGIELGIYDPAIELSESLVSRYQALTAEHAVPIRAVLYSMPPARWPEGGLASQVGGPKAITGAVDTARIAQRAFGLSCLGLWPGADVLDRRTDHPPAWRALVASTRTIADALADDGIRLAVEYKPRELVGNADAALRLCDAVDRSNVGVLLDTGHALWAAEDLPIVVRMLADRLFHLHLGDTPGDIDRDLPPGWNHDFTTFMAALDDLGYDGAMSLDMYGCVVERVLTSAEASRIGFANIEAAAARARTRP